MAATLFVGTRKFVSGVTALRADIRADGNIRFTIGARASVDDDAAAKGYLLSPTALRELLALADAAMAHAPPSDTPSEGERA